MTNTEYCQGYVPFGTMANYWLLSTQEKADAFDMLMRSTSSNLEKYPEEKLDDIQKYVVFTESGEQWDNYLTLSEAEQCLANEKDIGEGKLTYREMTDKEKGL
jgi:hypothetical protein